jgi:hypothetical protein
MSVVGLRERPFEERLKWAIFCGFGSDDGYGEYPELQSRLGAAFNLGGSEQYSAGYGGSEIYSLDPFLDGRSPLYCGGSIQSRFASDLLVGEAVYELMSSAEIANAIGGEDALPTNDLLVFADEDVLNGYSSLWSHLRDLFMHAWQVLDRVALECDRGNTSAHGELRSLHLAINEASINDLAGDAKWSIVYDVDQVTKLILEDNRVIQIGSARPAEAPLGLR